MEKCQTVNHLSKVFFLFIIAKKKCTSEFRHLGYHTYIYFTIAAAAARSPPDGRDLTLFQPESTGLTRRDGFSLSLPFSLTFGVVSVKRLHEAAAQLGPHEDELLFHLYLSWFLLLLHYHVCVCLHVWTCYK